MLIEFSVSNFLSFREKQTFSMVATPRLRKRENVFKPDVKGEKLPDLLKAAAIYGPNASGKSNLIKALELIKHISSRQPSAQTLPLPVAPFRFDPLLVHEPSRIELHFVYAGQRYEFELAATSERIIQERLVAFPKGKETELYDRRYSAAGDEYTCDQLEGGKDLHETWQKLTGSQTLFIAQAVANSSENLRQLREPLKWLQNGISIVGDADMLGLAKASQNVAKSKPEFAEAISLFLQEIDVPVTNIRFDPIGDSPLRSLEENTAVSNLQSIGPKLGSKTRLTHKTALGEATFDFKEESRGTQNLIGFWLPWWLKGISSIDNFFILIVDELDSSLHPKIVASLVEKHLKLEEPTQLIFTTHDTHLMDTKLLRRDQFWLTERDMNGATQLRCIHDFEGRESEDVEKRYYEGRYRGLPFLR